MSEKKLRILMTNYALGGSETHLLSITKELLRKGASVVVMTTKGGSLSSEFLSLGCPLYTDFDESEESKEKIRQIIQEHNINIIHSHDLNSCLLVHHIGKELRIPQIYTVHGIYLIPNNLLDRQSIHFVSISPLIYAWLLYMGIPSTFIPNGIDLKEYRFVENQELRRDLNIPEEAPVVLYVSRLGDARESEICKLFLEASIQLRNERFPSLHVVVAGESIDNSYLQPLISLVESAHSTSDEKFIHMLGKRRDLPELYSIANCVVGAGRVALEAMVCERVVVAVGYNGFFGIVEPKTFNKAWLYHFGDHKSIMPYTSDRIAADLKKVLLSPSKQKMWGKQSRDFIAQNFEIESVVNRLLDLYRSHLTK
jgi:L-malate glycosyltransferase